MGLLQVSSFSLNRFFLKFFLTRCDFIRMGGVTAVHIVKPSEANNGCDFGL